MTIGKSNSLAESINPAAVFLVDSEINTAASPGSRLSVGDTMKNVIIQINLNHRDGIPKVGWMGIILIYLLILPTSAASLSDI